MIDNNIIIDYLKNTLSEKRYIHSINAAETAEKLAEIFGADSRRAFIAGLVHDCTRETDIKIQQQMIAELGLEVDELTYNVKELLHAHSAEYIMRNQFKIDDAEIISAVRSHTTGKENMSILEKIVFLSDVLEPSRNFPGVENIRRLAMDNINEALLAAFDSSIRYLIGKRTLIHPDTFFARNYILNHFNE